MYIRFVIPQKDESSGREMGVFAAGGILRDQDELYEYEIERRKEIMIWFSNNLDAPFVQATDSKYYGKPLAISWFKSNASLHISKMREYIEILKSHDLSVKQIITERPVKVVYEDKYQVAAIPFQDTFK